MFELVFVACIVGALERCEEKRLSYVGHTDAFRCMAVAPQYLASWVEQHPGRRIASWRCRVVEERDIDA